MPSLAKKQALADMKEAGLQINLFYSVPVSEEISLMLEEAEDIQLDASLSLLCWEY